MLHANLRGQPSLTVEEREHQRQMMMTLLAHWGLTNKQKTTILGLSSKTNTSISNYKKKGHYLPLYRDIQDRVGHIFAIHKCLRQAYPANKELAYRWITTPNRDFNNQTPFEVIAVEGFWGLVTVRRYLESNC